MKLKQLKDIKKPNLPLYCNYTDRFMAELLFLYPITYVKDGRMKLGSFIISSLHNKIMPFCLKVAIRRYELTRTPS